jgi:hypothetical protein
MATAHAGVNAQMPGAASVPGPRQCQSGSVPVSGQYQWEASTSGRPAPVGGQYQRAASTSGGQYQWLACQKDHAPHGVPYRPRM